MRKVWGFVASVSCAISVMAPTCGGDDSSNPLDAGDDIDASGLDAGKNSETSTKGEGGSEASTGPGTVSGIVESLTPIAGAQVIIGTTMVNTAADGKFTFPDVPATYTLTVVFPGGGNPGNVVTYIGATTRSPVVGNPFGGGPALRDSSQISVTASGTGLPVTFGYGFASGIATPTYTTSSAETSPANVFPNPIQWQTPTDALTVDLFAYVTNQMDHGIYSLGFDHGVVLPNDGGTVSPPEIVLLNPAAHTTITGTFTTTAAYPVTDNSYACVVSEAQNETAGIRTGSAGSSGTFTCEVPSGVGLNYAYIQISGTATDDSYSSASVGVPSLTGTVALMLDPPTLLTAPAANASDVDLTKPFTWTTPPTSAPAVYAVQLTFDNSYWIYGASISSATIPDLSSFGIPLPSTDGAQAEIIDYERVTVDSFLGATPTLSDGEVSGASQTITFDTL